MSVDFRCARGFSLLEVLLAAMILACAVSGLAHLVAIAAAQTVTARHHAVALVLAQSKLEELRSVVDPALSPADALVRDCDGFVDRPDAAYVRRWSVRRLVDHDPETLNVRVCVWSSGKDSAHVLTADACASSIHARQP